MRWGRALKPLEKAGQVGLGSEQTETQTELFLYKILLIATNEISKY